MNVIVGEKRPRATHKLGDIASSAHERVETPSMYIDGKGAERGVRRAEKIKRYKRELTAL